MNEIAFNWGTEFICICSQLIAFKKICPCVAWIFPFSLADTTMCMANLMQGVGEGERKIYCRELIFLFFLILKERDSLFLNILLASFFLHVPFALPKLRSNSSKGSAVNNDFVSSCVFSAVKTRLVFCC